MPVTLTTTTDLKDLAAATQRIGKAKPAMQAIAELIRGEALRNFREGGRYPSRWQPSIRAAKEGGQTLMKRGILRNSITASATEATATAGTSVKYAGIHQFGGTIRIASRGQMAVGNRFIGMSAAKRKDTRSRVNMRVIGGHTVTMPARPFMPISASGELSENVLKRSCTVLSRWITTGA